MLRTILHNGTDAASDTPGTSATAARVIARAHGGDARAWARDSDGTLIQTDEPLTPGDVKAWAPPGRGVRAVAIRADDVWGADTVANIAAAHGLRTLARLDTTTDTWVGFLMGPAWTLVHRAAREVAYAEEQAARSRFARRTRPVMVPGQGEPVPALAPGPDGRFTELVLDDDGTGQWRSISATAAMSAGLRPPRASGPDAWRGRSGWWRPARDVMDVVTALADDSPRPEQRPWILVADDGRARAVRLPSGIRRDATRWLLGRGIPSIHAWRACFLAVDGDSELAVEATMLAAEGRSVVGAFSGSTDSATGFRHLCLVVHVTPDERAHVAQAVHDTMARLATERGMTCPELHVARPGELSRLPCTPAAKRGRVAGAGFVVPVTQPRSGPTVVEAISAATAARLLELDGAATVSAASTRKPGRRELAPSRPRAAATTTGWLARMTPDVRWWVDASADDLTARGMVHADGTTSRSEAVWRIVMWMRARGATAEDVLGVLGTGGAVADYLSQEVGADRGRQLRQLEAEISRCDGRRRVSPQVFPHGRVAEAVWQAAPTTLTPEQEAALAVLLDTMARRGHQVTDSRDIEVALGARALVEAAPVSWASLGAAAAGLAGAVEVAAIGGRTPTGILDQTTWVIRADRLPTPASTVARPPLERFSAMFIASDLLRVRGVMGDGVRVLTVVDAAGGEPVTRAALRAALSLTPGRLSKVARRLADLGLVVATAADLRLGPVGPAAAAITAGGAARADAVTERLRRERAVEYTEFENRSHQPRARAVPARPHNLDSSTPARSLALAESASTRSAPQDGPASALPSPETLADALATYWSLVAGTHGADTVTLRDRVAAQVLRLEERGVEHNTIRDLVEEAALAGRSLLDAPPRARSAAA